jgi:hypothetical protein
MDCRMQSVKSDRLPFAVPQMPRVDPNSSASVIATRMWTRPSYHRLTIGHFIVEVWFLLFGN